MKRSSSKFAHITDLDSISNIDDILAELAKHEQALIGTDIESLVYFSRTYGATNKVIFQAIKRGYFSQPALMQDLQIQFARLYFKTLNNYAKDGILSRQWQMATGHGITKFQPAILSLFLAICAHIKCDATFALKGVNTTSPKLLESDYSRVNQLLLKNSAEIIKNYNPDTRFHLVNKIVKMIFVRPVCFVLYRLRKNAWRNFSAGTGCDSNHKTKLVAATSLIPNTRTRLVCLDCVGRMDA